MEFAENNRISHRQLYRQMILGFLAPFWLCMSGRGKLNGVDAVIGTVIAVVLLCFYVVFLIRLAPAFEDLKKTAGAFMGRLTGAFFLLFIHTINIRFIPLRNPFSCFFVFKCHHLVLLF